MLYPGFLFVLASAYGFFIPTRWYRIIPLGMLVAWMTVLGKTGYGQLHPKVAGLDEIALGLACLAFGLAMSLWKIGLPQALVATVHPAAADWRCAVAGVFAANSTSLATAVRRA